MVEQEEQKRETAKQMTREIVRKGEINAHYAKYAAMPVNTKKCVHCMQNTMTSK